MPSKGTPGPFVGLVSELVVESQKLWLGVGIMDEQWCKRVLFDVAADNYH